MPDTEKRRLADVVAFTGLLRGSDRTWLRAVVGRPRRSAEQDAQMVVQEYTGRVEPAAECAEILGLGV